MFPPESTVLQSGDFQGLWERELVLSAYDRPLPIQHVSSLPEDIGLPASDWKGRQDALELLHLLVMG
jgi:hypothetical protein